MRHNPNSRTIKVKKRDLLEKIRANKENHKKEYEEAVSAYRIEAKKQLNQQKKALEKGDLNIHLNLVAPVNMESEYDKLIQIFEWEVEDHVELSTGEFNEYVLDETHFAVNAKMLNSTYLGGGRRK